jgi:putative nucleotidyltransferase with HDIG domain
MDVYSPKRMGKPYIAIVVGDATQRSHVASSLMSFYRFAEYPDISPGLSGFRGRVPRLALVSEQLAGSNGFDFVRMLRLDLKLESVPVVMLVAEDDQPTRDKVVRCGADDLVSLPFTRKALLTTISGLLNGRVERQWRTLHPDQRAALAGTLELFNGIADGITNGEPIAYETVSDACKPLVAAVGSNDFRGILDGVRDHDNYSFAHSMRVATYLALFGFNLSLSKQEQLVLAGGGLLHDVGKMSIPHEVLNKPGRLNAAEFAVMKGHVLASVAYLRECSHLPKGIITIAEQHHEKLDGSGYPFGLSGNQLNRLARMASIIDVFSALTDRRVYKPPMEPETALAVMVGEMSSHLDMKLLKLFRQMLLDATREMPRAEA